jgi:hypothetical protein
MEKVRIENMVSPSGNSVANQFLIYTDKGVYFQSYDSIIAFKPYNANKIQLDKRYWDYSKTTGKYRNLFLRESKKETEEKIKLGRYELVNLN